MGTDMCLEYFTFGKGKEVKAEAELKSDRSWRLWGGTQTFSRVIVEEVSDGRREWGVLGGTRLIKRCETPYHKK